MQAADNAAVSAGAGRPFYERLLPRFLFDDHQPWWSYALKGWLLILLPSVALAMLLGYLVEPGGNALPNLSFPFPTWVLFLGIVIFAPVTETLLMLGPLLLVNRLVGPGTAVAASSALWGGLHSLSAPAWGLVAWWPFLVFSAALLFWRGRGRLGRGILLVMLIHAMQNFVPFAVMTWA